MLFRSLSFDASRAINTVVVRGAEPEGKGKRRAEGRMSLPAAYPLSPSRLARHGQPRHMTLFVDTELETDLECKIRAEEILRRRSHQMIDAELRVLPVPMVEELDVIRVVTGEWDFTFPLRHWVLPFAPGQPMVLATQRRADRRKWVWRVKGTTIGVETGTGRAPISRHRPRRAQRKLKTGAIRP